ncbi:MAG: hypothetical protein EYC70_14490 [Planctomycetota bacterium]|nr:MAG: hypothetical protein EYC70_14490 [Planctomycetota bacterium]
MSAERSARLVPWLEGAALAAAAFLVLLCGGEAVRASYHGFLHAALGEAVLRDGLAPENPYHAGAPLRYYTLYPALGVLLGRAGIGPLWAFAAGNVLAALLFAPALDALGRAFGLSFRARRGAFLAAVLGFNALGWLGFLLPHDSVMGLRPVFALRPMTFAATAFGWDPRLQAFLPKFLNVSSFALALPFAFWAMAEAAAVGGARAGGPPPRPWRAAVHAAAALALNPLVGAFAGVLMAAWAAPALRAPGRARWTWPLAGALAVGLALPFLLPALAPATHGESLIEPAFRGTPVTNLVGPLALVLIPGVVGAAALRAPARWRWTLGALCAAAVVLLGEMPWGNEYKMARLGGVLWALPAGVWAAGQWERRGARRWLAVALLALSLPTSVAVPYAYVAWGRQGEALPLRSAAGALEVHPHGPLRDMPQGWLAVEAAADPAAVLLLNPFRREASAERDTIQGEPLAPLLHHSLFVDYPQIHNDGMPDLRARLALAQEFYARPGAAAGSDPAAALQRLRDRLPQRPFLALAADAPPAAGAALLAAGAQRLWSEGGLSLWLLPPARPATEPGPGPAPGR